MAPRRRGAIERISNWSQRVLTQLYTHLAKSPRHQQQRSLNVALTLPQSKQHCRRCRVRKQLANLSQVRHLRNTVRNMQTSLDRQVILANETSAEHHELMEQLCYRPGLRNISNFGGYNLALKRNIGHTSCEAATAMVAGDAINGGFTSKNIILRFEQNAEKCQRIRSSHFFADVEASICATSPVEEIEAGHKSYNILAIGISSDASNQSAVDKAKILATIVRTWSTSSSVIQECAAATPLQNLSNRIHSTRQVSDLQRVEAGTGEEMYRNLDKALSSVSCPTLDDVANNAHLRTNTIYLFAFNTDMGPDCTKNWALAVARLVGMPLCMSTGNRCMLHGIDLCVQNHYSILDAWVWQSVPEPELPPVEYIAAAGDSIQ